MQQTPAWLGACKPVSLHYSQEQTSSHNSLRTPSIHITSPVTYSMFLLGVQILYVIEQCTAPNITKILLLVKMDILLLVKIGILAKSNQNTP